jgi:hypothetical protein
MWSDADWRSSGLNVPLVKLLNLVKLPNKEGCCADILADEQQVPH